MQDPAVFQFDNLLLAIGCVERTDGSLPFGRLGRDRVLQFQSA